MKSKIRKSEGSGRELEIVLSAERVEEAFSKIIEEMRVKAEIPGFRKGKAPFDIVRKKYREDALDEMKKRLVPVAYQEALDDHEVVPVSYPELDNICLDEKGCLTFTAKVDVYPETRVRKYKGIKVVSEKISVTDAEVNETVEKIRDLNAEFETRDKQVEKGDFGICDIEAFVDEKPISNKREDAWIEAEKESSMLGLGEEICGLKKGDEKDIEATLPENYPDKQYAGKKARFHVRVKEVKVKKLPEVDDELAKKIGKENMKTVKDDIKNELLNRKEQNNKVKMKNQIIEHLLKKHSFDLPAKMVERQIDALMKRSEDELAQKGVDKETITTHKEELNAKLKIEAENKVKLYFILDTIARLENISVSDEDVDRWLRGIAEYYKQPFDNVKKYYKENNLLGGVEEQLREDYTLDFLLEQASLEIK